MGDGDEQSKDLRGSSSSGSANAMKFEIGSVDALSELVWSPRNGLSLRCADFSFSGKPQLLSPNIFHHIGQTTTEGRSKSMSIQQQEDDTTDNEGNHQEFDELNRPLSGDEGMKPNDDSREADKRAARSLGIGGETEALLANEQLRLERAAPHQKEEEEEETNRLEATDENHLTTPASKALVACESKGPDDSEMAGLSGSHQRLAKAKGKEKALSDGNFDDDDDDDEESFGSVESCNSAGLLLRGKKRPGFEQQQLILGSKRLKTLSQECLGSTSKHKQDSSFMNWISNMTKGIWKGNEQDNSPFVALTTTSDANGQGNAIFDQQEMSRRNTGFQSFFQSIYCPKKRDQGAPVEMGSSNDANVASLQELPWIPEQCLSTKGDHLSSSGNEDKEPNISLLSPSKSKPSEEQKKCNEADEKVTLSIANKNSGLESLWISRFSSKRSLPHKSYFHGSLTNEVAKDANDSSSDAVKTQNIILPIVSSLRIESSEAMASLFARRLEAMKHIMPSGSLAEKADEGVICFYCGKKGHRLQDCLQVTDIELRDLVQNVSASNGKDEATSLCIRCFQLSHWAATCPNAPMNSTGAEDRAMKHALASLPFSGFTDVPKAVFDAVQVLRLTRTDVLKWINTKKSVLGLEGFFLRLRLGKWEEGLGGTGYHVARIQGATEGQSSKKQSVSSSIPVKVGGMTCFVESQFISNHDFLEEELKAWWRSAGKRAGRSGGDSVPSAEELNRKVHQRKMLGF